MNRVNFTSSSVHTTLQKGHYGQLMGLRRKEGKKPVLINDDRAEDASLELSLIAQRRNELMRLNEVTRHRILQGDVNGGWRKERRHGGQKTYKQKSEREGNDRKKGGGKGTRYLKSS